MGSLGYNEMAVALMLASGLLIAFTAAESRWCGALLGVVAAAACGAKLTAVGFVAAPLGVVLLATIPPRRWAGQILAAGAAGLVVLAPYFVRNLIGAGNPVFPFATALFGLAHWTPEQLNVWNAAHSASGGVGHRLAETWNQLLRYGLGTNPAPREPWAAQWLGLPWLAGLGVLGGLLAPKCRRVTLTLTAILLVQLLFWLPLAHLKSRFMAPAVVPASLSVVIGATAVAGRLNASMRPMTAFLLGVAALMWAGAPAYVYSNEPYTNRSRARTLPNAPSMRIGLARILAGDTLTPSEHRRIGTDHAAIYLNHRLEPEATVLLAGEAAPLYYDPDRVTYQTTWDRGPLSAALRASGEGWIEALRGEGFTHVLVDATMLEVWQRSEWNDPLITADRVLSALDRHATLKAAFPNGQRIYDLRGTSP